MTEAIQFECNVSELSPAGLIESNARQNWPMQMS